MRIALFVPALLAALAVPAAHASTVSENFNVTGVGISSSGTLTLTSTATAGVYDITGISGTFSTRTGGGFSGAISGLNPASYSSANPTIEPTSTYDNLFYANGAFVTCAGDSASSQSLDTCGLDFLVGNEEVNIYATPNGPGYQLSDARASTTAYLDDNVPVTFVTTAATPEPTSLVLLGTGVLGVAGVARRRFLQA